MYVCVCKAVTDKQIAEALEDGARSLADIKQRLQVGTQCGRCHSSADAIVKEHTNHTRKAAVNDFPIITNPLPA